MTTSLIRSAISQLKGLGTIPAAAMRILAIAEDPGLTEAQMYDALALDPSLASRVLKVVNSAYYRRQREVASCRDAIRLLGIAAVRNIAIASSLHRLFRAKRQLDGFDPSELWTHAIAVGAVSRELASRSGKAEPEAALLAGLLHDFGIIAEAQVWPAEFARVVEHNREASAATFRDAERSEIGMSHDEVGALLCGVWNLPAIFADVCRYHHDIDQAIITGRVLPQLVHVADVLAARASFGFSLTVEQESPHPGALATLGLTDDQLAESVEAARASLSGLSAMLAG